jgi:manganese-dependent inorganic pyrophosphatase
MSRPIYVIGHKHSDLDSIASAYGYARLLQLRGEAQPIAARQGELKPEVRFVLERFHVDPPEEVEDVYLRVGDVMQREMLWISLDQPLLEAGRLLQERRRLSLPVVDAEHKVCGILATEDFAKLFFRGLDPRSVNHMPLQQENLVRTLDGHVLVEGRRPLGESVLVGAMQVETMVEYIEPGCLVVLGDREDAQLAAMEHGAAALVVTGDLPISERTQARAHQLGVLVIRTAHHTFTAAHLITLSLSVQELMSRDFASCHAEDRISEVQDTLARRRALPVVESDGRLIGYLSRTDLISAQPKQVILVDHNERSQAVDGLDEAELLGVIDHHRISDVHTNRPILFRAEAVGSTSTIVAGLYREAGIVPPREVAGLLLAGLLNDTLILHSPTCTQRDKQVAGELAELAGEDLEPFGRAIFAAAAAELGDRPAGALLTADCKEFAVQGSLFAIGTVETASPAALEPRIPELYSAMQRLAHERGYSVLLFMIVDILELRSRVLIWGGERAVAEVLGIPLEADGHSVLVEGLVSRKKQVVSLLEKIQATIIGKRGIA